jgi:hypothetical protein
MSGDAVFACNVRAKHVFFSDDEVPPTVAGVVVVVAKRGITDDRPTYPSSSHERRRCDTKQRD